MIVKYKLIHFLWHLNNRNILFDAHKTYKYMI